MTDNCPQERSCYCCCYEVTSVVSDSVRPHGRQPTRLPCPWDSPGKNTGVGCHFLLQCIKVKSESQVAQSCLTLSNPMDCSLPGSSVHGIFQAGVLEWGATAFSACYWSCINKFQTQPTFKKPTATGRFSSHPLRGKQTNTRAHNHRARCSASLIITGEMPTKMTTGNQIPPDKMSILSANSKWGREPGDHGTLPTRSMRVDMGNSY